VERAGHGFGTRGGLRWVRDQQQRDGCGVVVNVAAGGVGNYAVQLAHALGARVTAAAGAADVEFVAGLGADQVIDYAGPPSPRLSPALTWW